MKTDQEFWEEAVMASLHCIADSDEQADILAADICKLADALVAERKSRFKIIANDPE